MENKLLKIEIVFTAIILIIACFVMGITVIKRVEKGSGEITTENYAEYMQVDCRLGNGMGGGNTMEYKYYVIVRANEYYSLKDVTISYSLKSNGANLPDGSLTVTLEAGKNYSQEYKATFTVTRDDTVFGMWNQPTLEIVVTSVSGTYQYSV